MCDTEKTYRCYRCRKDKPASEFRPSRIRKQDYECRLCRYMRRKDVIEERARSIKDTANQRTRPLGVPDMTLDDAISVLQEGKCLYCHHPDDGTIRFQVDHRLPISRGGDNRRDNLALACTVCNQGKGVMTDDEYMDWLVGVLARIAA